MGEIHPSFDQVGPLGASHTRIFSIDFREQGHFKGPHQIFHTHKGHRFTFPGPRLFFGDTPAKELDEPTFMLSEGGARKPFLHQVGLIEPEWVLGDHKAQDILFIPTPFPQGIGGQVGPF